MWSNTLDFSNENIRAIALVQTGDLYTPGDFKVHILSIVGVGNMYNFKIDSNDVNIGRNMIFATYSDVSSIKINTYTYDNSKMYGGLKSNTIYRVPLSHTGAGNLGYNGSEDIWAVAMMTSGDFSNGDYQLYLTSIYSTYYQTTKLNVNNNGVFPIDLVNNYTTIAFM